MSELRLESPESASPIITRLVGAALTNRDVDGIEFATWQKFLLTLLNRMPVRLSRYAAQWDAYQSALDPDLASGLRTDHLALGRLGDYARISGRTDVVVVGAALGGAAAHIAAVLGAPFLPQPFILSFRGGSPDDKVQPHLEQVLRLAAPILANNPDLHAIGHFDPVHDGWLTRRVTHLRLKLIRLPVLYRNFLQSHLKESGAIVYLDCKASWEQYELGSRLRYQIGGWGDISPSEFRHGSPRIDRFLEARGSPHRGGWELEGFQLREERESEWGSVEGLASELEDFASEKGYQFHRIEYHHPHDYSLLAYRAHNVLFEQEGIHPRGVLVETFTQYNPYFALKGRLLPLWLIFNTEDSCRFLAEQARNFTPDLPIYLNLLVTLGSTPDMAPYHAWGESLKGLEWMNIGAQERRYPVDLESLWKWSERLREHISDEYAGSLGLDLEAFMELV